MGLGFVAAFLLVLSLPPARDSVLIFPALFSVLVGVIVLAFAKGPRASRNAALVLGAYVLIVFGLLVGNTPITLAKQQVYVNPEPPAFVGVVLEYVLDALPAVMLAGAAVALWPWSGRVGRGLVLAAGALLMLFLVVASTGRPDEATTQAAASAARWGALSSAFLALAAASLLAADMLVLARDRLRGRVA